MEVKIALFQKKEIRKTIQENEWWFVITDVIAALTDSVNPAGYFKDMRRRDAGLAEALKGGGNLPPPWPRIPHCWRAAIWKRRAGAKSSPRTTSLASHSPQRKR